MRKINCFLGYLLLFCLHLQAQELLPPAPAYSTDPFVSSRFYHLKLNSTDLSGDGFSKGREIEQAALAYCHPQSPHRVNIAYKNRLLLLLNHISALEGDFGSYAPGVYACAILKKEFPNNISTSEKINLEASIQKKTDAYLAVVLVSVGKPNISARYGIMQKFAGH